MTPLYAKFPSFVRRCSVQVNKDMLLNLRRGTGASFAVCKEALISSGNDVAGAHSYIANKLNLRSSKLFQQNRVMTSGLVGVGHNEHSCVLVKMNCETDFVAKTSEFLNITGKAVECLLAIHENSPKSEGYESFTYEGHEAIAKLVEDFHYDRHLKEASGKLGEKLVFDSAYIISYSDEYVPGIYAHSSQGITSLRLPFPNKFGRIGAVVLLESIANAKILELAHSMALQITGNNPYADGNSDQDDVKNRLLLQNYLIDPNFTVKDILEQNISNIATFYRSEHQY